MKGVADRLASGSHRLGALPNVARGSLPHVLIRQQEPMTKHVGDHSDTQRAKRRVPGKVQVIFWLSDLTRLLPQHSPGML